MQHRHWNVSLPFHDALFRFGKSINHEQAEYLWISFTDVNVDMPAGEEGAGEPPLPVLIAPVQRAVQQDPLDIWHGRPDLLT